MQPPQIITKFQGRQITIALLAIGSYIALLGVVFMMPFLMSARAQENDVFMGNLYFSPILYLLGSTILITGFSGLGLRLPLTVAVAIANLLAIILAISLVGRAGFGSIQGMVIGLLSEACLLLAASIGVVGSFHKWDVGGRAALLATCGAAVVTLGYILFGSRYYAFGETTSSLPPYLNTTVLVLGVVAGLAILVLVFWPIQKRAGRRPLTNAPS